MRSPEPARPQKWRIAVIGSGLIGSAWGALFAARGFDVAIYDPDPAAEAMLDRVVSEAAEMLGLAAAHVRSRLAFTTDLAAAVDGAHFVQECAPEQLALKQALFAGLGALTPSATVLASSTSDFPMSLIQKDCRHPERTLVGHPINPPYAVALVEVVPSPCTSPEAVALAQEIYLAAGKRPLVLSAETAGFVANRLQMALFREALQLVARGEASVGAIDQALMHGLGPRFAAVGLFGGYVLNVPGHDVDTWLDHIAAFDFGEAIVHTGPMPEWTPELRAAAARQWRERVARSGVETLRRTRDRMGIAIDHMRGAP